MKLAEILNLIAIIIIPIIAVIVGQWLQTRSEKRKDKMHIFKTLMTSRVYGWTQESVYCLNIIDIYDVENKVMCFDLSTAEISTYRQAKDE